MQKLLADAIDDRRDLSYRPHIDATIDLLGEGSRSVTPVVEVTNNGNQIVSLLSMRVSLEDEDGIPSREMTVYAATPVAIDSDWRGPLLPGSKRRFALRSSRYSRDVDFATVEINELRVWNGEGVPAEIDLSDGGEIQIHEGEDDDNDGQQTSVDEEPNDDSEASEEA